MNQAGANSETSTNGETVNSNRPSAAAAWVCLARYSAIRRSSQSWLSGEPHPRLRVYMECTVSTAEGRTWTEYQASTCSRIVLCCSHCQSWVSPEREHLVGWQGAVNQEAARRTGAFSCSDCGEVWSADDRLEANRRAKLLHQDQSIDPSGIQGNAPATDTLGFRWSAIHNLFLTPGEIADDE